MKAEQEDCGTVFAPMGNLLGCQVMSKADVWALTCKGVAVGTYKRVAGLYNWNPE